MTRNDSHVFLDFSKKTRDPLWPTRHGNDTKWHAFLEANVGKSKTHAHPLHYQDPRGSAKTIFLDSLSACKDMPNAGSSRKMEPFPGSCFQKFWFRNFNIMQFKQGDVFLRKNTIHSFENALLGGCHFSRVPQIGLMSVARFSWVPNLYNIHFLVENHRPQPDPVNSHRVTNTLRGA